MKRAPGLFCAEEEGGRGQHAFNVFVHCKGDAVPAIGSPFTVAVGVVVVYIPPTVSGPVSTSTSTEIAAALRIPKRCCHS